MKTTEIPVEFNSECWKHERSYHMYVCNPTERKTTHLRPKPNHAVPTLADGALPPCRANATVARFIHKAGGI